MQATKTSACEKCRTRTEWTGSLQVRHIGVAKQLGDLAGLREHVYAVEPRRRVNEAEVLVGGAAENRERRQREAGGELGVDGVGKADASRAGEGRGDAGAGSDWEAHGLVT